MRDFRAVLMCALMFTLMDVIWGSPSGAQLKYEEYLIEHEVSWTQAKNAVLSIDLDSLVTPHGCQTCTQSEINYCLGKNLIADHCCCDKRHHEKLYFVPHTCYIGPQLCETIMKDCIEYARVKRCCCDKYVIKKWKDISSSPPMLNTWNLLLIFLMYLCIYVVNIIVF